MTGRMDEKSFTKNDHDVLYYIPILETYCLNIAFSEKKEFLPNLATLAHPLYLWRWIFIWSPSGENRPKDKRNLQDITETVSCKNL
jgi:hypothetical protein